VPTSGCDDGTTCTIDFCTLANGCEHNEVSCFDMNACTIDSCDHPSGLCQNIPIDCSEDFTQQGVPPGGSASTGADATPSDPFQVTVTTPAGGASADVTIVQAENGQPSPDGLALLNVQFTVTVTPLQATPSDPLRLSFVLDGSVLRPGTNVATIVVFQDGAAIEDCAGPPGTASPDPCVESRVGLPNGDAALTVLSSGLSGFLVPTSTFQFALVPCAELSEVPGVGFAGDKETLTWASVSGTTYDVLRGLIAELPVGTGPSEACLVANLAASTVTDSSTPGASSTFWYLVRSSRGCGPGPLGSASDGTPRASEICP
jgi:hypothetical protein